MSPVRAKKAKTTSKKAAKKAKAARPARPVRKAKVAKSAKPARGKASKKPVKGAVHEKRHCTATDPFGDPCQSAPRLPSKYCTIHSYLDR